MFINGGERARGRRGLRDPDAAEAGGNASGTCFPTFSAMALSSE